ASPIESIELFKNGVEFMRHTAGINDESVYTLVVTSKNQPLSGLEAKPRNRREWIGFLATRDTDIEPEASRRDWRLRRAHDKRFDFLTWLHGGSRRLNFKFEKPTPDTVLEVGLASIIEDAAWLPADRSPQLIPSQHFLVPLHEMQQGAVREFDVAGYRDRIEVGPAVQPGEKDVRHNFVDTSAPRIGDYYYVKTVLTNGAYAYSSPIFVEKGSVIEAEMSYDHDETAALVIE
nr:hypothetical protein [Pseudomonadales bacterium]